MADATLCDDRGPAGFSWVVDELMQRTSHALVVDGRVWLVDPTDVPWAMARVAELGEPAGVLQLLDRHNRDCEAIATRLGVPHHVCPGRVEGAPFAFLRLTWRPWWREVALWWVVPGVLVVPEAVGTTRLFTADRRLAGVHPMLRLTPPRRLLVYEPRHLLTGHGAGLVGEAATDGLKQAIASSRRDIPAVLRILPSLRKG